MVQRLERKKGKKVLEAVNQLGLLRSLIEL
jgi:hypothetical protein